MNQFSVAFWAALAVLGLATVAAMVAPRPVRPGVVGAGVAVGGAVAVVAGVVALAGHGWSASVPGLLPLAGLQFALDPLGGLFVAVAGGVAVAAGVYGVGYAGHGLDSRTVQAALPLFVGTMLLVPAAQSVGTFLVCWELMALASLVLVAAEHRRRPEVAEAARWYAVMTHLGFVAIMVGLVLFAANAATDSFGALREAAAHLSPPVRAAVFVAVLAGFAAKAGIVPLHAWLPRAHPEAPSHVSALMSAAMVNLGAYGVVRVGFDLLGTGRDPGTGAGWWWLVVLVLGAVSAVYGILQAAVSTDVKRLLGYSTTENLGLVFVGIGAAGMFAAAGNHPLAGLALAAALLHVVNHAAFKTVLFLAAGSVLHATGSRDLDALGGLRRAMPATTGLFALGALAASALPPGNAFVSEWLLLQGLIHGLPASGVATAITMPVAVAVVALTAGLAVATFVKAFGVGFLARARSLAAEQARESPPSMVAGMAVAGVACVVLAVAPTALFGGLARAAGAADRLAGDPVDGTLTLQLTSVAGSLSPVQLAAALLVAVLAVLAAVRLAGALPVRTLPVRTLPAPAQPAGALLAPAQPVGAPLAGALPAGAPAATGQPGRGGRRVARLWDCGAGPLSPRMEYTATSFAEPLQRVFDDVLRPEQGVDVTHAAESAYLVRSVEFHRRVPDRIERRLYEPVLAAVRAWGQAARGLANGSVHRYLGYGFVAVTALLIVLAAM